jgi:glycerol-3-phosphate cytidylyltransferase
MKMNREKKVMIFGTFDVFHKGHENFIKQARQYGDYLIAVVARDKTVAEIKGQDTTIKEKDRAGILRASGLLDEVVLGRLGDKYELLRQHRPDVICLGYDQRNFTGELRDKLEEFGLLETKIVRLKPYHPEKYKSSLLKKAARA